MKRIITVAIAAGLLGVATDPRAYTARNRFSITDRAAMADLVVAAEVKSVKDIAGAKKAAAHNVRAELRVLTVLKGSHRKPTLEVRYRSGFGRGPMRLGVGRKHLFFLISAGFGKPHYTSIVRNIAALADTPENRKKILPAVRCCSWKKLKGGLRVMLSPSKWVYSRGENIDLLVIVRNPGAAAVKFTLAYWPRKKMTWGDLRIRRGGKRIKPKKIPWATMAEIEAYWSKGHHKPYSATILPGDAEVFRMSKVNTAAKGYAYKRDLGFVHYPMKNAGTYTIEAELHNYIDGLPSIKTAATSIQVR